MDTLRWDRTLIEAFQFYTGYSLRLTQSLGKAGTDTVVQTNFNTLLKKTKNTINLTGTSLLTNIPPTQYTQF